MHLLHAKPSMLLSLLFSINIVSPSFAITITTPSVSSGELIRAQDWNKVRTDLQSLATAITAGLTPWNQVGSNVVLPAGLNAGIGDTSPGANLYIHQDTPLPNHTLLQVGTSDDADRFNVDEDGDVFLDGDILVRGSDVYDSVGNLELSGEDDIYVGMDWNNDDNDTRAFIIGKNNAGPGGSWTELMRVDEGGNVGIGTTSPGAKLDVAGDIYTSKGKILNQYPGASLNIQANRYNYLKLSAIENTSNAEYPILKSAGQDLWLYAGNRARLTIKNSGNVGIGTTTPGAKVEIVGTTPALRVRASNSTNSRVEFGDAADPDVGKLQYSHAVNAFQLFTNNTEKVRITSTGNVGIGTTNPQAHLHVKGGSAVALNLEGPDHVYAQFYPAGYSAGRKGWLGFGGASNPDMTLANEYANGDLILSTNGTGNVGIGTASPEAKLDVAGTIRAEQICDETGSNCQDISSGWATGGGGGGSTSSSAFHVQKSATQNIPTSVSTKVTWDTEIFDSNDDFDTVTGRFTPTVAGKYILNANTAMNAITHTAQTTISIYKNGVPLARQRSRTPNTKTYQPISISIVVDANGSSDYFEVYIAQYSGSTKSTDSATLSNFSGSLLGGGGGTIQYEFVGGWATATCSPGFKFSSCNSGYTASSLQVCGSSVNATKTACSANCGGGPYYVQGSCYKQ